MRKTLTGMAAAAFIGSALSLGGCATNTSNISNTSDTSNIAADERPEGEPHPTTARIHVTRESAFAGSAVVVHIVDSGKGIDKPALLVEKEPRGPNMGGDWINNVALIEGEKGLLFGKKKYLKMWAKSYGDNWREQALGRKPGDVGIGAHYTSYRGTVKTGGTIVWDRSPGTLQIEAIDWVGHQIVSKEMPVEAGKDYYVFVQFMGPIIVGSSPITTY